MEVDTPEELGKYADRLLDLVSEGDGSLDDADTWHGAQRFAVAAQLSARLDRISEQLDEMLKRLPAAEKGG